MFGKKIRLLVIFLLIAFLLKQVYDRYVYKSETYEVIEGRVHGTFYRISYKNSGTKISEVSLDSLFHRFDLSLSTFKDSSIISKINRNEAVALDSFFVNVFNTGSRISQITDGAFDMTVAPLVNAWGFGFKHKDNVSKAVIDTLLSHIGYKKVSIVEGKLVKTDSLIMLDASAIAKGYSCDVVSQFIESNGIFDYLVEIGGEIVAKGANSKGKEWVIGIEKPVEDSTMMHNGLQTKIKLSNLALATSGNYRQYYYRDGKKFSHTVNPHTGYPVEHNLLSASVIADNCMTADAFATAFMVLGLERSLALADSLPNLEAYFISSGEDGDYIVNYTKGFQSFLCDENEGKGKLMNK